MTSEVYPVFDISVPEILGYNEQRWEDILDLKQVMHLPCRLLIQKYNRDLVPALLLMLKQ
jgi:hypothetical protein